MGAWTTGRSIFNKSSMRLFGQAAAWDCRVCACASVEVGTFCALPMERAIPPSAAPFTIVRRSMSMSSSIGFATGRAQFAALTVPYRWPPRSRGVDGDLGARIRDGEPAMLLGAELPPVRQDLLELLVAGGFLVEHGLERDAQRLDDRL